MKTRLFISLVMVFMLGACSHIKINNNEALKSQIRITARHAGVLVAKNNIEKATMALQFAKAYLKSDDADKINFLDIGVNYLLKDNTNPDSAILIKDLRDLAGMLNLDILDEESIEVPADFDLGYVDEAVEAFLDGMETVMPPATDSKASRWRWFWRFIAFLTFWTDE